MTSLLASLSDRIWTSGAVALSDDAIAGQLRTDVCAIDNHMRRLANAAAEDVEFELKIGLMPQVREMRLDRFPHPGCGIHGRIRLDWRSVWNAAKWAEFVALSEADDHPKWMETAVTAIESYFAVDFTTPLSITYGGCAEEDPTVIDPELYTLGNSERGDYLCPVVGTCGWPTCGSIGCDGVVIRYVVGFLSPCDLERQRPKIAHNLMAMFGYLHESPELQSTVSREAYESVLRPMRRGLKWRP